MGGSWGDQITNEPTRASSGTIPSNGLNYDLSNGVRSGRSSYIDFTLNKDMEARSNGFLYRSSNKREDLLEYVDDTQLDGIGEFTVLNEAGIRYVNALPLRNKDENNLSYGMRGVTSFDEADYIAFGKNDEVKLGSTQLMKYASSYLLTEINTPDYIDRTYDGPTLDDFGGYTRFSYSKEYGEGAGWYKWRAPYQGLRYQRNELSDKRYDLGSVRVGEKEIYYLSAIETKSLIAIFAPAIRINYKSLIESIYTLGKR